MDLLSVSPAWSTVSSRITRATQRDPVGGGGGERRGGRDPERHSFSLQRSCSQGNLLSSERSLKNILCVVNLQNGAFHAVIKLVLFLSAHFPSVTVEIHRLKLSSLASWLVRHAVMPYVHFR